MAIAEVIGNPRERRRAVAIDVHHALALRNDLDHLAARGDDEIAAAHDFAAGERDRHLFTRFERRALAAPLSQLERQAQPPVKRHVAASIEARTDFQHQKRKYRCAIGSDDAGSQVRSSPSARTS